MSRRPDRVLFPESGFTKADAIAYYRAVGKWLLPHLKNVPVSFKRYPDTSRGESFWEKDAPSFTPAWVRTVGVPRRSGDSDIRYIVVNDAKTLAWVAGVGGIEIHPFLHRVPRLERATAVVFDLDPGEEASLAECCDVALLLRDGLAALKLESYAKVSGSKGLQVYAPLNGDASHAATEQFARLLADELARRNPKLVTAKMGKQFRRGKVFIDWSQNADYKTTVSVYSLRAKREHPFVSMPVTWDEVEEGDVEAMEFAPAEAIKRLRKLGDLWAPMLRKKQKLPFGDIVTGRATPQHRNRDTADEGAPITVRGIRLPKPRSQSGRRLFVLMKTDKGNELWIDMHDKFKRWILRPDREGGSRLIAMPAGDFAIDPAYYRGEVPAQWRGRSSIEDIGSYELIEGSYQSGRFDLWFTGKALTGGWSLAKLGDERHRSWALEPAS